MPSPESQKIMLIIIDQLRADYLSHFKKCSSLLPYQAVCSTNSFPASTESMHANISTGMYPKDHGFISKNTKGGQDGLVQLVEKLRSKQVPSLASLASESGFSTYVIGGKEETVRVMGTEENCALMIHYDKKNKKFIPRKARNDLRGKIQSIFRENQHTNIDQKNLDRNVLVMANELIQLLPNPFLYIVTLSSLDSIGHASGPNSNEVHRHLAFLDNEINSLVQKITPSSVIITGDHGCRNVSRYVIEPESNSAINVYCIDGQSIKPYEQYKLTSIMDAIQYDGGLLRIWMKENNNLSEQDLSFFSRYGYVFPHYIEQGLADKEIERLYYNSIHENLGDVFVIAQGDASFLKLDWIHDKLIQRKVAQRENIKLGDLPIGEHGTYDREDNRVCFLSNIEDLGPEFNNVQIYNIIKRIMS